MAFQMSNSDWFSLPGEAVFDRETQQIASVSRSSGSLDLFVIGNDNRVWTTSWNDQTVWNSYWFTLPGQGAFDRRTQQIAALSRVPGNLDLFVIGNDDHVWTTFWNDQLGWSPDWITLPGQAVFDRATQQIAAVSRASGNLDLFAIGIDNHVWSTFWGPHDPITLNASLEFSSHVVPLRVAVHIEKSPGSTTKTEWTISKEGVVLPGVGNSIAGGQAFDGFVAIGQPANYEFIVNRTGVTGPWGSETLTKRLPFLARSQSVQPPVPVPPKITATFSGTISAPSFHVTGSGFLANRPASNQGVAVRVVDANALIETRREFTPSTATSTIDHTISGDLSGLTLNALGTATIAISATDGRNDPSDITRFLWSNTVTIGFP